MGHTVSASAASSGRTAYAGPEIVTGHDVLSDHAVLVSDGRIEAVLPRAQLPSGVRVTDLGPGYLTAGLIDVHVHGAAGRGYHEATPEAFASIGTALLAAGVTTALPTLASAPVPDLSTALDALEAFRGASAIGPSLPGAHLEGPYFSHGQRGAQDSTALRVPSDGSVEMLLERADAITMMSFAPELDGAVHLTERLVAAGIVAAAGHTDGTADDLARCEAVGLSHVIHVFSGQSTTLRRGPWRVPGMLEATLASDTLTVEMIADGKHLPPLLMRLAHRGAGDRLCLVSDATAGAGLPEGSRYEIATTSYDVVDGVGMTLERDSFGGSTTLLGHMLPIARDALGLPLPDLITMVTSVPARAARLPDVGHLLPGYRADLTLFDHDLVPRAVALRGTWHTTAPTEGTIR
ncbi:amidohydrolase family protein [Georgenia satyanarayanai]|uniref:N-acetylglucosamine-6-phosphate deacetylase n=1 Tax=Georgenia satyanarayanai TaxID=860221 RepID=UPI0020415404|nr:amidohydrolase family protein [Georgenia satyanarayanai]MCM3661343.1 amidohydrolase family protein [Georgenia satyanarayanai]